MDTKTIHDHLRVCEAKIFESPQLGLDMIRQALSEIRAFSTNQPDLEARALAILGGAYRGVGQHDKAEDTFENLGKLLARCTPTTAVKIQLRLVALRATQNRFREALERAQASIEQCEKHGLSDLLAATYTALGTVHLTGSRADALNLNDAVACFIEALKLVDAQSSPRYAFTAVHNLCLAIAEGPCTAEQLETALALLGRLDIEPGTVPAAKIAWARGTIHVRFGATVRAARLLEHARLEMIRHQLPFETALVSLDLGALCHLHGDWDRLARVAADAVMLFRDRYPWQTLAALLLWRDAIHHRDLSDALCESIRGAVADGALPISSSPPDGDDDSSMVTLALAAARFDATPTKRPGRRARRRHLTVSDLDEDAQRRIEEQARAEGVSRAEIVRRLLRGRLDGA